MTNSTTVTLTLFTKRPTKTFLSCNSVSKVGSPFITLPFAKVTYKHYKLLPLIPSMGKRGVNIPSITLTSTLKIAYAL